MGLRARGTMDGKCLEDLSKLGSLEILTCIWFMIVSSDNLDLATPSP